jgi:hypothetical protein
MKISLRKASAVQNRILETIRDIKIQTSVQLNEFQPVESVLKSANDLLFANDHRRQTLLAVLYNIRGLIGAANSSAGIDLALTKSAYIDKRLVQLTEMTHDNSVDSIEVINGRLNKIKETPANSSSRMYGQADTVESGILSADQLSNIKREILSIKKQKQKINDEILELNIKTEIPLTEETVNILTAEGLI